MRHFVLTDSRNTFSVKIVFTVNFQTVNTVSSCWSNLQLMMENNMSVKIYGVWEICLFSVRLVLLNVFESFVGINLDSKNVDLKCLAVC